MRLTRPLAILGVLLSTSPAFGADIDQGIYLPFDDVPVVSAGGASVRLNGNTVFAAPDFEIQVDVDAQSGQPTGSTVEAVLRGAVALEVQAQTTGTFAKNLAAPVLALPPIQFGPTVLVLPFIAMGIEISGTAEAGMRVSAVQEFEIAATAHFGKPNPNTVDDPPRFRGEASPPEITGGNPVGLTVSTECFLTFLISYNGFTVGGPTFSTSAGLSLQVNPTASPWWNLDLDLAFSAGAFVLGSHTSTPIWQDSVRLDQANGAMPGVAAPTRWSKAYALDDADGAAVAPSDGGYFVVGNGSGAGDLGWFLDLREGGGVRREQRAISQPYGFTRPRSVHATPAGGLVVGGDDGGNVARVEKLTKAGAVAWSKTYGEALGGQIELFEVVARPTGGTAFCGSVTRVGVTHPLIVWLDARGEVEDALELDPGAASTDGELTSLIPTTDGGWIAAGAIAYQDLPSPYDANVAARNGLVVRVDAQNQLVFAKAVGGTGYDYFLDAVVLEDGGVLACGKVFGEDHSAWLACLDADGSLRWSGTYSGDDTSGNNELVSLTAHPDGGAIAAGHANVGAAKDALLLRVDPRGMPVWMKTLRGAGEDDLVDVALTERGLIATGLTKSFDTSIAPKPDLWVARTGVDGMLHFKGPTGFVTRNDDAAWAGTADVVAVDVPLTPVTATVTETAAPLTLAPTAAAVLTLTQ